MAAAPLGAAEGWAALRLQMGLGRCLVHLLLVFPALRWLLLSAALVVPLNCSYCVTGHGFIHLTFFWCPLGVTYLAGLC